MYKIDKTSQTYGEVRMIGLFFLVIYFDFKIIGCLIAWMLGCLDAWMLGCLDAWMLGCLDAWMLGCLDAWMLRLVDQL